MGSAPIIYELLFYVKEPLVPVLRQGVMPPETLTGVEMWASGDSGVAGLSYEGLDGQSAPS
jgi:hypothetical protein